MPVTAPTPLTPPFDFPIVDPKTGKITTEWQAFFRDLERFNREAKTLIP
jgi:hypothetical protein